MLVVEVRGDEYTVEGCDLLSVVETHFTST